MGMTLSERIETAKARREGRQEPVKKQGRGYCPVCLNTGHKAGFCLLQRSAA